MRCCTARGNCLRSPSSNPFLPITFVISLSLRRFVSYDGSSYIDCCKRYKPTPARELSPASFVSNIKSFDHIVGNVRSLSSTTTSLNCWWPKKTLGPLTNFAFFTAEDVGTPNSGLNSVVYRPTPKDGKVSSSVLMPLNEPVDGTIQSQITTFLNENGGEGVQHVAISCLSVASQVRYMKSIGVDFMPPPPPTYYDIVWNTKVEGKMDREEFEELSELGI